MNSMVYGSEEKTLALDCIKWLLDYNEKSNKYFNDIHLTTDGTCLIVEWVTRPYDNSYGGEFKYVEEDQAVLQELRLPDNTTRWVFPEEEKEVLEEFLKENPEYYQNQYGHWINKREEEEFRKMLNKE